MSLSITSKANRMVTEPRHAASLIVLRDGTDILMARRSDGHRFMPGMLVFPGGAVDEADHHARAATPLSPRTRARLERVATPALAHALAMAAARELTEEVGMSLGTPPALDGLTYLCRAITPPDRSIRFDAHFFIVDAARTSGMPVGSQELEEPRWYTVQDALAAKIPAATGAVLGQLQRFLSHHDRNGPVPTLRDRVWHTD